MARGTALIALLDDLRAEARVSLNPAHNNQVRDTHVKLLQRVQKTLYEDHDWSHLDIEKQYPAQAGLREYDFGADFDLERINRIEFKSDGRWLKMTPGITAEHYAAHDSDLDQRAYPPRRWRIRENNQIEIWPISDQNADPATLEGYFKVSGIKKLAPLVADNDRADLDDTLIVLYAAAEILGEKSGQIKLTLANKRLSTLLGRLTKRKKFKMFGIGQEELPRRPVIGQYRAPGS